MHCQRIGIYYLNPASERRSIGNCDTSFCQQNQIPWRGAAIVGFPSGAMRLAGWYSDSRCQNLSKEIRETQFMEIVIVIVVIIGLILVPKLTISLVATVLGFRRPSSDGSSSAPMTVPNIPIAPTRTGLGITLAEVSDTFCSPDLGRVIIYGIAPQPDGLVTHMGYSNDGREIVLAFGPANNLIEVAVAITADGRNQQKGIQFMNALLVCVVPEWESSSAWVSDYLRLVRSTGRVSATHNGKRITLMNLPDAEPAMIGLSVFSA